MSEMAWMDKLEAIVRDIAAQESCVLYDIEFVGIGKGRTLRLYIDKDDGSVGLDDCANVSRRLNEILDAQEDLVPGDAYNLEVSTPGLERRLTQPWHFQKVVGKKVYIKCTKAFGEAGVEDKKWKAGKTVEDVLASADDKGVRLLVDGVELNIPYAMIDKAKVIFEMTKGQKK